MTERGRALAHLARGIEELLRAGAEALAALREHDTRHGSPAALEAALRSLAEHAAGWLADSDNGALRSLRGALQREVTRWDVRATDDPTALRVRDLFQALLDVIGDTTDAEAASESRESRDEMV